MFFLLFAFFLSYSSFPPLDFFLVLSVRFVICHLIHISSSLVKFSFVSIMMVRTLLILPFHFAPPLLLKAALKPILWSWQYFTIQCIHSALPDVWLFFSMVKSYTVFIPFCCCLFLFPFCCCFVLFKQLLSEAWMLLGIDVRQEKGTSSSAAKCCCSQKSHILRIIVIQQ